MQTNRHNGHPRIIIGPVTGTSVPPPGRCSQAHNTPAVMPHTSIGGSTCSDNAQAPHLCRIPYTVGLYLTLSQTQYNNLMLMYSHGITDLKLNSDVTFGQLSQTLPYCEIQILIPTCETTHID